MVIEYIYSAEILISCEYNLDSDWEFALNNVFLCFFFALIDFSSMSILFRPSLSYMI